MPIISNFINIRLLKAFCFKFTQQLDAQAKEISSLKHSLKDSETLLLDANRALCQKTQDLASLQEQYQELMEENEIRCGYETELFKLREENILLKKSLVSNFIYLCISVMIDFKII